jgi:hypothetical protein
MDKIKVGIEIEVSKIKDLLLSLNFDFTEDQKQKLYGLFRYAENKPEKFKDFIEKPSEYYCQLCKQTSGHYSVKLVEKNRERLAQTEYQKMYRKKNKELIKQRDLVSEFREIEKQIEELMNKELTKENISEINNLQIKLVQIEEQMTKKDLNRLKDGN